MSNLTALKCVWRNGCPNPRLCAELQCCGSLQVKKQPEALASNPATEALACFEAAFAEGWHEALANGDLVRIRDIWARRIMFAHSALCSPPETTVDPELQRLGLPQSWNEACAYALKVVPDGLGDDDSEAGLYMTVRNAYISGVQRDDWGVRAQKSESRLSVPAATPPAPNAEPDGATNGTAAAGTVLPDRILKLPQP